MRNGIPGCLRVALLILLAGILSAPPVTAQMKREEDLEHDSSLPREEQIRRHKLRVQKLLAEYQAKANERKQQTAQQQASQIDLRQAQLANMRNQALQGARPANVPRPVVRTNTGRPVSGARTGVQKGAVTQSGAGRTAKSPFRVSRAIVYFSPFENLTRVGDEFETEVKVFNSSEKSFDEVALHLNYDPLVVAPLRVNDSAIYERLEGDPELRVNSSRGKLRYSARLREGLGGTTATLLTIHWRALNPVLHSRIDFESGVDKTHIGRGGANLLGYVAGGTQTGGTLSASVAVAPRRDSPRTLMPLFSEIAIAGIDEPVHLRLEADSEAVAEDDEWIVSLALRNDATLPFNNVCVKILFDPAKLEVVDWHRGNWIRHGINIYDGFAHETYPFEVHRANQADNERGEILYHMATGGQRFFPSGELARIKFRALADASLADVRFDFEDPSRKPDEIVSDVDFLGSSVLFLPRRETTKTADRRPPDPLRSPDT